MMEVRWGGTGGTSSSCRPNLVMASSCATSALYFLAAERTPLSSQRSCTLLDQTRSASAASHCSTSGALHPHAFGIPSFWSKSPCHERRRRGKCNFASEGSSSGQVSVAGSVAVMESVLEVMEWRSRSSQQLQDPRRDSEEVTESQNYPVNAAEIELEPAGFEKSSGLETEGTSLEEPLAGKEEEGSTDDERALKQMGAPRGWRGLALGDGVSKLNSSKAFLLKRPWRKSNSKSQRFRSAENNSLSSSPTREEYKLVGANRDASLEDLFKSLASPRASVPSGAVERYFGRELNKPSVSSRRAEMAAETTSALEGFSSGNTVETDSTASFNLPGRLKINLDLDLYRASCLRQEGRLDEAEAILKECVRDWPDDGRAYLSLGLLAVPLNNDQVNRVDGNTLNEKNVSGLEKNGLFPGDYFTYEDVGDGSAKASGTVSWSPVVSGGERLKINLDLQLYHAKCLKQKGRRNASETVLRKCIKDWPDDGRPYVALGKLLLDQNRIQDARTVYDSGCQTVRGENPYIWQAWAILEEKCGDISKARKLFDAAIVADKKHVSAWHGWAKLELRAGNLNKARSLLNKGLKSCGSNEYIFQTLALLEMGEGKVEEARSLLSKATKYNPKSAASWLAWALMEAENNFTDTARALFQKGLEASPKNRYVWQAWAGFESRQGREERARELFQRGRELNPKDVVILQAYALFEYSCGRPGIARDIFRRAVACDSKHQPVLIAWGWMEWKEGNLSVAREFYQGAIQVDSRSLDAARAFQAWGTLEDREGDTGLARELFKCALKIDSQNVPTWMSWAAMEDREGRFDRADEIRNQYLQERTEVVEAPWDVDITDILAPAIDRIKGFFKGGRRSSSSRSGSTSSDITDLTPTGSNEGVDVDGVVRSIDSSSAAEEFDVDRFLKKKFPFKYGFLEEGESVVSNSVQEPNDRF